jgi:hypothetical protein
MEAKTLVFAAALFIGTVVPGFAYKVTVLDSAGRTVAGAKVECYEPLTGKVHYSGITDANGVFEIGIGNFVFEGYIRATKNTATGLKGPVDINPRDMSTNQKVEIITPKQIPTPTELDSSLSPESSGNENIEEPNLQLHQ